MSLTWNEVKPLYHFESYEPEPNDVPDDLIELLHARIVALRGLYGQIGDGNEAKRLFFIAPILETVCHLLGNAQISVEESIHGKIVHVHGRFEFVLERGAMRVPIIQVKDDEFLQGMAQMLLGLEALADGHRDELSRVEVAGQGQHDSPQA